MLTFGKKIAAGFFVSSILLVLISAVAYRSVEVLGKASYSVTHTHVVLEHISGVLEALKDAETGQRGFVITGDETFLEPYESGTESVGRLMKELRELTKDSADQQRELDEAESSIDEKLGELKRTIAIRRTEGFDATAKVVIEGKGKRAMDGVRKVLGHLDQEERELLKQRSDEVEAASASARSTIIGGTLASLLFVIGVGVVLTRSLGTQIGTAVQHIRSSSQELQLAANQQASGAKESSTSINEISTTISELMTTSRQIAQSAQRVATVADQTVAAARVGEGTLERAAESITGIRRQVDLVVTHMLDLGKKSQQIGGVLELVSELAEQTNILAINATIEAAGAGDHGKRFAVVADEIRKLADRVAMSTKEIRGLIEDVRGAVNTTVMATETGSKAVDAGHRQFDDVAASFKEVAALIGTTTDAAREIELSTKQQATAVEQVNVATANTVQATRETESSATQTLQTASQLATLSRELLRIVQPEQSA